MDQQKIGKFIACLRRRDGLTQEALGQKLGVSNKTISRWENGNYMPDIEMLQLMSSIFHVGIHEILAGQFLSDTEFRRSAEETLVDVVTENIFSMQEKESFWKRKWYRDHIFFLFCLFVLAAVSFLFLFLSNRTVLLGLWSFAVIALYVWQYNRMRIYVEEKLYDKKK